MLLIWRGYGFVVIPIIIAAWLLAALSTAAIAALFGPAVASYVNFILFGLAFLGAAMAVRRIARHLDARGSRELIDPRSGTLVILRREHSLYFIRLEYWAMLMLAAAGLMAFGQIASWFAA